MKRGAGRKNKRVVAFDDTLAALAAQEAAAEAENAVGANEASDWAMPMDEASDGGSDDDGDEVKERTKLFCVGSDPASRSRPTLSSIPFTRRTGTR